MGKPKKLRVKMPEKVVKMLDMLVEAGLYPSRNEAIRAAIRMELEDKNG